MKLFKLYKYINPEYGDSFGHSTTYYLAKDVEKVLKDVEENFGYRLSKDGDEWNYSHYYSMDREELIVELFELECITCD